MLAKSIASFGFLYLVSMVASQTIFLDSEFNECNDGSTFCNQLQGTPNGTGYAFFAPSCLANNPFAPPGTNQCPLPANSNATTFCIDQTACKSCVISELTNGHQYLEEECPPCLKTSFNIPTRVQCDVLWIGFAWLLPSNEIPAITSNQSNAFGQASCFFDFGRNLMNFNMTWEMLSSNTSKILIQRGSASSSNGTTALTIFDQTGAISNSTVANLTVTNAGTSGHVGGFWNFGGQPTDEILNEGFFFQVASDEFPGGEIRGQIKLYKTNRCITSESFPCVPSCPATSTSTTGCPVTSTTAESCPAPTTGSATTGSATTGSATTSFATTSAATTSFATTSVATTGQPFERNQSCPFFDIGCSAVVTAAGTTFTFLDFNFISFGSFSGIHGDVQGRVAVQNNFFMEDFIIGELITNNNTIFSLVVGGNATILSGQVQPASASIFVAEEVTIPANFTNQVVTLSRPHLLDTAFQEGLLCYFQISILLSKISQNVVAHFSFTNLVITCPEDARIYSITLFPETLNLISQFQINATTCNPTSHWVINVPGTGNVNFTGTPFPPVAGGAVFNIFGSGRTIFVDTDVNASILAPNNFLVQTSGFIQGKVVVGDATSVKQISLPICPTTF